MDSIPTSRVKSSHKVPITVTSALVSVFNEWLLIFLLFIDASFSYLITRFARHSKLKIPCLLCSRLDCVLGDEKIDIYSDLFCQNHKLKISSLVLCQLHDNLVDVRETCESCFFSFATINKSNAETYRLLVGKLGAGPHHGLDQEDPLPFEQNTNFTGARKCICCKEEWVSRTCGQKLVRVESIDSETTCVGNKNLDPLSHVEYEKVKVHSDTESESDVGSCNILVREMEIPDQDSDATHLELENENAINSCSNEIPEAPLGHGLEELKWEQAENRADVTAHSDLISFAFAIASDTTVGILDDESKENHAISTDDMAKEVNEEPPKIVSNDLTNTTASYKEVPIENDPISSNEIQTETKPIKPETSLQTTLDSFDLGDAYKLALGTKGRQLSGKFLEQQEMSMKDSTRASEDLKLLLSQLSSARGFDISINDISPRVPTNNDDYVPNEFQRRVSLERNESIRSLDGSTISEIEGESLVDRLKRQVEYDKKVMASLYRELEEERNASSDAANQAMAMITRLQEEKSSLHMEALQCVRMMEEQAEYDGEAFQRVNELLVEKEKMVQDLEYELEQFKNTLGDFSRENISNSTSYKLEENNGDVDSRAISVQEFEAEKRHILKWLKNLEEKLSAYGNFQENGETVENQLKGEIPAEGLELIREIASRMQELHSAQERTRNEDLT